MNPSVRRIAPFILALFVSSAFAANNFDPTQFSTGNFHGCPPTGQGSDPYLNSLKNRDKPPTTSMTVYTVDQLYQVTPSLPNRKVHRDKWTAQQRDLAAQWESRPVVVEGYLIHAPVREKAEACNCGSTPKPTVNCLPIATSGNSARPTKSVPRYMVASPGRRTKSLLFVSVASR